MTPTDPTTVTPTDPTTVTTFDINAMIAAMVQAAEAIFQKNWQLVQPYAENEFLKFTQDLALIQTLSLSGQITPQRAALHIQLQVNSMQTVFLAVEGIGILTAEEAINAVLGVIATTVNKTLGFDLLLPTPIAS